MHLEKETKKKNSNPKFLVRKMKKPCFETREVVQELKARISRKKRVPEIAVGEFQLRASVIPLVNL